jgi:hypothetical protein
VSYYPTSSYSSGVALLQGNLIGIVSLPSQYILSFDIFPTSDVDHDWLNLVILKAVLSNGADCTLPRIEAMPSNGGPNTRILGIGFLIRDLGDSNFVADSNLALNAWSTVTVAVDFVGQIETFQFQGQLPSPPNRSLQSMHLQLPGPTLRSMLVAPMYQPFRVTFATWPSPRQAPCQ